MDQLARGRRSHHARDHSLRSRDCTRRAPPPRGRATDAQLADGVVVDMRRALFQGWVTWQTWDSEDGSTPEAPTNGMVTVTFSTPGNGHALYATPRRSVAPGPR